MNRRSALATSLFTIALLSLITPARADSISVVVTAEHNSGYVRELFKHWIDADGDGCDTRKEVLLAEAITKPSIGSRCALTGGSWYSAYEGANFTNSSSLDIDHVVALAEAWRSGAWSWTAQQRQDFANDLDEPRALIAVSASRNRSKGDSDPAQWLPDLDRCTYIETWVNIKVRYALTFDPSEMKIIKGYISECKNFTITDKPLPDYSETIDPASPSFERVVLTFGSSSPSSSTTTVSKNRIVGGSACKNPKSTAFNSKGEAFTCKWSSKTSSYRWLPS